jgi:hypothetical protein
MARAGNWNHNVHYQPVILNAVPAGCGPALDVGCGDGLLARRLAERCAEVRAAAAQALPGVRYRRHLLWRYSLLWTKPA